MKRVFGMALVGVLVGCGTEPTKQAGEPEKEGYEEGVEATGEPAPPPAEPAPPAAPGAPTSSEAPPPAPEPTQAPQAQTPEPSAPVAGDLSTLWATSTHGPVLDLVLVDGGAVVALETSSFLSRHDANGKQEWRRRTVEAGVELQAPLFLRRDGNALVTSAWVEPSSPEEREGHHARVEFSPDGSAQSVSATGTAGVFYGEPAYGPPGASAMAIWGSLTATFYVSQPGVEPWSLCHPYGESSPGVSCSGIGVRFAPIGFHAYAFDATGNLVVTGRAEAPFELEGKTFGQHGQSLLVLKFSPEGKLLWGTELPGVDGRAGELGFSAKGTVVVAGDYASGGGAFGSTTIPSPGRERWAFVMVIEPDGRPRWFKHLPGYHAEETESHRVAGIAVDPLGKVTMVENLTTGAAASCSLVRLTQLNLAGAPLSQRDLDLGCSGRGFVNGVAFDGSNVIVGGRSGGGGGFLMKLKN